MNKESMSATARRAGISVSFMSRMKRGERRPSMSTLIRLEATMGKSGDEVLRWLGWNKNGGRRE